MKELKKQEWEESYARQENFIFYPKEEVVKFLNRFVKKRTGVNSFHAILDLTQNENALDLGCGIGRQTILFEEFGLNGYGVDISKNALESAKQLALSFNYEMQERFILLDKPKLPFTDDFFDIAISDSVLDSMSFDIALQYMVELNRTVKSLVYLNLVCGDSVSENFAGDVVVEGAHEVGTIQSYYNQEQIEKLIANTDFKVLWLGKNSTKNIFKKYESIRYHVILKKEI